jgi:hypothetical protein
MRLIFFHMHCFVTISVTYLIRSSYTLWCRGFFFDHFTDIGLLGQVISSSEGLYLNTGQHKHSLKPYTYQISMPCLGLEPTIPASERAKTVHASDRSATVAGYKLSNIGLSCCCLNWFLIYLTKRRFYIHPSGISLFPLSCCQEYSKGEF